MQSLTELHFRKLNEFSFLFDFLFLKLMEFDSSKYEA